MPLHGLNIIAGRTLGGGPTYRATNPAGSQSLEPLIHEATLEHVDLAMKAAESAFDEYRHKPAKDRAAFLDAIAAAIAASDEVVERAAQESGLGLDRLRGERARTAGQLRMFARLIEEGSWVDARIDHADANRKPLPKPDVRRMLIPMGPVVIFAASNFPLAFSVAGGDTASALAAGCPVVVKTHPAHPGTSEMVGSMIAAAAASSGMPAGVFSMLHSRGHEVSVALVKHPLTRAVGFTGSLKGGRALFDVACARPDPIPVYAEMGSINPVFVLPGAMAERGRQIAEGLRGSVTLGVGQFCTNPGVIIGLAGETQKQFVQQAAALFADAPPGTMLYGGLRDAYEAGAKRFASTPGVKVLAQSREAVKPDQTQVPAMVFSTDAQTFLAQHAVREELFGPSTVLVAANSVDEMEAIARTLDGHLTATIQGTPKDLEEHKNLVDILQRKVGRLIFNAYPTGVEVCASMQHGGPYPATTDSRTTSVGTAAIDRFARPICFQGFPDQALPQDLREANPRGIWRLVDGARTK
jgi:2,5-dioxopentanoate dehydrogenase